jgi:glycogen debranching enzyme GlgX
MTTSWPRPGVHVRPDGGVDVGVLSQVPVSFVCGSRTVALDPLGDLWHAVVPDVPAGSTYALSAGGSLLVDPWAVELEALPWAVVRPPPEPVPSLGAAWREQVVYELSVRAYTAACPWVPAEDRGTFRGLGHPAVVHHLSSLGVTAVELLPVSAWETEPRLQRLGLDNQWGYNPVSWMAVESSLGSVGDVIACVQALHAAGLAVIQDVVFNHTSEGPDEDPVLRHWRTLWPTAYLRGPGGVLDNRTGCGHTVDLREEAPRRAALDALRQWASYGLDGFRFDLAAVAEPLVPYIAQDPALSQRWMIAEPWDAAGGRGHFPAPWSSWSDGFRDAARDFWLHGSLEGIGAALTSDVSTVAFAACHDGFTLADVTSYVSKVNDANGEDGRDGSSDNHSANAGAEGSTSDPAVLTVRRDWQRALLATVLLSPSVPMLSMGDELGFSQGGNNNGYCQPFEVDWSVDVHGEWIAALTALRSSLGLGRLTAAGPLEARWLLPASDEDWARPGPVLLELEGRVLLGFNPLDQPVSYDVGSGWKQMLCSGPSALGPRSVTVWSR